MTITKQNLSSYPSLERFLDSEQPDLACLKQSLNSLYPLELKKMATRIHIGYAHWIAVLI